MIKYMINFFIYLHAANFYINNNSLYQNTFRVRLSYFICNSLLPNETTDIEIKINSLEEQDLFNLLDYSKLQTDKTPFICTVQDGDMEIKILKSIKIKNGITIDNKDESQLKKIIKSKIENSIEYKNIQIRNNINNKIEIKKEKKDNLFTFGSQKENQLNYFDNSPQIINSFNDNFEDDFDDSLINNQNFGNEKINEQCGFKTKQKREEFNWQSSIFGNNNTNEDSLNILKNMFKDVIQEDLGRQQFNDNCTENFMKKFLTSKINPIPINLTPFICIVKRNQFYQQDSLIKDAIIKTYCLPYCNNIHHPFITRGIINQTIKAVDHKLFGELIFDFSPGSIILVDDHFYTAIEKHLKNKNQPNFDQLSTTEIDAENRTEITSFLDDLILEYIEQQNHFDNKIHLFNIQYKSTKTEWMKILDNSVENSIIYSAENIKQIVDERRKQMIEPEEIYANLVFEIKTELFTILGDQFPELIRVNNITDQILDQYLLSIIYKSINNIPNINNIYNDNLSENNNNLSDIFNISNVMNFQNVFQDSSQSVNQLDDLFKNITNVSGEINNLWKNFLGNKKKIKLNDETVIINSQKQFPIPKQKNHHDKKESQSTSTQLEPYEDEVIRKFRRNLILNQIIEIKNSIFELMDLNSSLSNMINVYQINYRLDWKEFTNKYLHETYLVLNQLFKLKYWERQNNPIQSSKLLDKINEILIIYENYKKEINNKFCSDLMNFQKGLENQCNELINEKIIEEKNNIDQNNFMEEENINNNQNDLNQIINSFSTNCKVSLSEANIQNKNFDNEINQLTQYFSQKINIKTKLELLQEEIKVLFINKKYSETHIFYFDHLYSNLYGLWILKNQTHLNINQREIKDEELFYHQFIEQIYERTIIQTFDKNGQFLNLDKSIIESPAIYFKSIMNENRDLNIKIFEDYSKDNTFNPIEQKLIKKILHVLFIQNKINRTALTEQDIVFYKIKELSIIEKDLQEYIKKNKNIPDNPEKIGKIKIYSHLYPICLSLIIEYMEFFDIQKHHNQSQENNEQPQENNNQSQENNEQSQENNNQSQENNEQPQENNEQSQENNEQPLEINNQSQENKDQLEINNSNLEIINNNIIKFVNKDTENLFLFLDKLQKLLNNSNEKDNIKEEISEFYFNLQDSPYETIIGEEIYMKDIINISSLIERLNLKTIDEIESISLEESSKISNMFNSILNIPSKDLNKNISDNLNTDLVDTQIDNQNNEFINHDLINNGDDTKTNIINHNDNQILIKDNNIDQNFLLQKSNINKDFLLQQDNKNLNNQTQI